MGRKLSDDRLKALIGELGKELPRVLLGARGKPQLRDVVDLVKVAKGEDAAAVILSAERSDAFKPWEKAAKELVESRKRTSSLTKWAERFLFDGRSEDCLLTDDERRALRVRLLNRIRDRKRRASTTKVLVDRQLLADFEEVLCSGETMRDGIERVMRQRLREAGVYKK